MKDEIIAAKQVVIDEIADKLTKAQSAIIVEYRGLNVADTLDLRRQLKAENIQFRVYKNTMTQRAVSKVGYQELLENLNGPNAIAFGDDAVAPARILAKFAKRKKMLVIKAGVIEGKVVSAETIKELSLLPNRAGMIAMILGCLQSPLRDFAYALKSIADKNQETAPESPVEPEQEAVVPESENPEGEPEKTTEAQPAEPEETVAVEETQPEKTEEPEAVPETKGEE